MFQNREGVEIFTLVSVDGSSRVVGEISHTERLTMRLVGDRLLMYHPRGCDPDCTFEAANLSDGKSLSYAVPGINDKNAVIAPQIFVNDSELLVTIGNQVWLVYPDDNARQIGYSLDESRDTDVLWTSDERLVISAVEPVALGAETAQYHIWDTTQNDYVWDGDYDLAFWVLGTENDFGLLWFEDIRSNRAILYRVEDHSLIRLPENPESRFRVIRPDGTLIYRHNGDNILPPGFYVYDPDTEMSKLLLPGSWYDCWVVYTASGS